MLDAVGSGLSGVTPLPIFSPEWCRENKATWPCRVEYVAWYSLSSEGFCRRKSTSLQGKGLERIVCPDRRSSKVVADGS